jgi:hypothetical protein
MTTQKTISRLAIAAIILVAGAITSLAQTKSSQSSTVAKTEISAPGSGLELAFNRNPFSAIPGVVPASVESKNSVERTGTPKATLSPASFMSDRFSFVNEKMSFSPQVKIYDTATFSSKRQFSTESDNGPTSSKHRVTFVPSMGQKIPN